MRQQLRWILTAYHNLAYALEEYRAEAMPLGSAVKVCAANYSGFGFVATISEVPPDKVAVRLENGNVWYYNLFEARPIIKEDKLPPWIKREQRRWKKGGAK